MRNTGSTHNILVISDLHLGEDLTPAATAETVRDLHLAERHLISFLRHYQSRRVDGRPWRLVINGDMVDLMTICILPGRDTSTDWGPLEPDEGQHGLSRRMDASCAKIDDVIERHRSLIETLAGFLAAGHRVDIICGNHDAELFWPQVQQRFRSGVARVWQRMSESQRTGAPSAEQLGGRIDFHDWFYYEPGVVWIEHGHQYDECCSFEYNLNPVNATGRRIMTNVDTAGMRYLTSQVPDVAPHGSEDWTFAGYLRLAYDAGLSGAWQLVLGYGRAAYYLLAEWRASRSIRASLQRRERHFARMRTLASEWPLSEEALRAVDGLHRRPVITNLRRLLQVLMLDKLLLWLVVIVAGIACLTVLSLTFAAVTMLAVLLAAPLFDRWLSRGRSVDPALPLDLVPERIVEHVDARYVVFGHTHLPVARRIGGDRWYFNTGTWLPSGKPGLLRSFTHLLIHHVPGGTVASLCQWHDGISREFPKSSRAGTSDAPDADLTTEPAAATNRAPRQRSAAQPADKNELSANLAHPDTEAPVTQLPSRQAAR